MNNNDKSPKHIFLFILDAVRRDHLGLYGYKRKTSPNINKLARQATVYNWAFAPSSYTLASVPAILTGRYPIELSNQFTSGKFTEKDFEKFKKIKKKGYKTAMFTANIVTSHYQTDLYKFFDYFWDNLSQKELNREDMLYEKADVVLQAVEDFIGKNKKEKFFIVIHLMEAHGPYVPEIKSRFKDDTLYKKERRKITRVVNDTFTGVSYQLLKKEKVAPKYQLIDLIEGANGEIEDFNRNVVDYIAKYDMGIYLLDKNLGEFIDFLKKEDLFDPSEIIITSDHGELLGEENIFFSHGIMCHPALISVPLIIKEPYQKKEKVVDQNFSLVSIIETIVGNHKSEKEVFAFHPQSLAVVREDSFIMFHNGNFSHNGDLKTSIFPTASFSLEQIFENFIDFKIEGRVINFRKDYNNLIFFKDKKVDSGLILPIYLKFIKYSFLALKDRHENQINHLTSQLSQQQAENQQLKTQTQNLTRQLSQKSEENESLKNQLNKSSQQINSLIQEKQELKNQLNKVLDLTELIKKEIAAKNRKINNLEGQLKRIEEEKQREAAQLKRKNKKIKKLESELKEIRKKEKEEEKRLIKENQKLQGQINQTKTNIQNLEATLNMIKSAKFFKAWQGYCKVMKVLKLKS